jgi:hypothetical protein
MIAGLVVKDSGSREPLWWCHSLGATVEFRGSREDAVNLFVSTYGKQPEECHRLVFIRGCRRFHDEIPDIEASTKKPVIWHDA